jgi:hypothetical protein
MEKLPVDIDSRDDQAVFAILLLGIFVISFIVIALILIVSGHTPITR